MRILPIYSFNENNKIKVEKLCLERETAEEYQKMGIKIGAQALILWKSGKKIILKISENKIAISERAAEMIFVSEI